MSHLDSYQFQKQMQQLIYNFKENYPILALTPKNPYKGNVHQKQQSLEQLEFLDNQEQITEGDEYVKDRLKRVFKRQKSEDESGQGINYQRFKYILKQTFKQHKQTDLKQIYANVKPGAEWILVIRQPGKKPNIQKLINAEIQFQGQFIYQYILITFVNQQLAMIQQVDKLDDIVKYRLHSEYQLCKLTTNFYCDIYTLKMDGKQLIQTPEATSNKKTRTKNIYKFYIYNPEP